MTKRIGHVLQRFTLLFGLALVAFGASAQQMQHIIVKTSGSREVMKQTIQALGGHIDIEYKNIPAVAATVPAQAALALRAVTDFKVFKDFQVALPRPPSLKGRPVTAQVPEAATTVVDLSQAAGKTPVSPADYAFNNKIIRADVLQNAGDFGQGVIVATIDTGIANNPNVVQSLAGSVIGGETFITNDTVKSATSTQNNPHGTWVGSMIAGHAIFFFSKAGCTGPSIQFNAPDSVIDGANFGLPGFLGVPLIGVAPAAQLYAFKVFASNSNSTADSIIIAAMDRALTLKNNFLAGKPSVPVSGSGTEDDPFVFDSLNIQVLNLSLGGPEVFAGRGVEDIISNTLADAGIVVSIAAGNAGPSGASVTSPGTGLNALTMGATITPTHDRIFQDFLACLANGQGAIGFGLLAHPTNFDQVIYFSSRGPTADGRASVGAVTAGTLNFAQAANGGLFFVSGTSFATPTGAGAAALLIAADPGATAKEVRNALIRGANDDLLSEHTTAFDRGGGYLDLVRSFKRLVKDKEVDDTTFVNEFSPKVEENLEEVDVDTTEIEPGETVSGSARLRPGDRKDFFIKIPKNVGSVTLNANVTPLSPPSGQNQLFGDDAIVAVHEAKMTGGDANDYHVPPSLLVGPASVTIPNPEPGFARVTVQGDYTNAGRISADFTMTATLKPEPDVKFKGVIADGQVQFIPFNVPAGLSQATFELTWEHDWTHYPTNDLDLVLIDPNGNMDFDGATLNGRERAVVNNPTPGQWVLAIVGFNVFGKAPQGDGSIPTPPGTDEFKAVIYLTK
jgi:hypothetical protein